MINHGGIGLAGEVPLPYKYGQVQGSCVNQMLSLESLMLSPTKAIVKSCSLSKEESGENMLKCLHEFSLINQWASHRPEEDLDPRGIFAAMRLRGVRPDQVAINPRNAPWT